LAEHGGVITELTSGMNRSYRKILGITFFGDTASKAIAKIRGGGLLVVPAAPRG